MFDKRGENKKIIISLSAHYPGKNGVFFSALINNIIKKLLLNNEKCVINIHMNL